MDRHGHGRLHLRALMRLRILACPKITQQHVRPHSNKATECRVAAKGPKSQRPSKASFVRQIPDHQIRIWTSLRLAWAQTGRNARFAPRSSIRSSGAVIAHHHRHQANAQPNNRSTTRKFNGRQAGCQALAVGQKRWSSASCLLVLTELQKSYLTLYHNSQRLGRDNHTHSAFCCHHHSGAQGACSICGTGRDARRTHGAAPEHRCPSERWKCRYAAAWCVGAYDVLEKLARRGIRQTQPAGLRISALNWLDEHRVRASHPAVERLYRLRPTPRRITRRGLFLILQWPAIA